MQKLALAAVAAICLSGVAFAGQATKPAAMTDADMDKVTAGDVGGNPHAGSNGLGSGYGQANSFLAPHGGNAGGNAGGNSLAAQTK
jgi:hypothetical protein